MQHNFRDTTVLLVNDNGPSMALLSGVLKVLGVQSIENTYSANEAFKKFAKDKHDIIISMLSDGEKDAIGLAELIRKDPQSTNKNAPIIALGGAQTMHLLDQARDVGVTDLLMSPYSASDVAARLNFCLNLQHDEIETLVKESAKNITQDKPDAPAEEWPDEEEADNLTDMLLDHYLHHHEIVFMKFKIAQKATKECINQVRKISDKVKDCDNSNIHEFKDFDQMWEEIIQAFVDGGLSEDDIFKVENLVTTMPADIKEHYDALSIQEKSFLSLVEGLNTAAYKKAKEKVVKLQSQPNPLHGLTPEDYDVKSKNNETPTGAFLYEPKQKK